MPTTPQSTKTAADPTLKSLFGTYKISSNGVQSSTRMTFTGISKKKKKAKTGAK